MRDAIEEAAHAHHIATGKAAALGGILANELQNGWPVEQLTFVIERTIAANAEVEATGKILRGERGRIREALTAYFADKGGER